MYPSVVDQQGNIAWMEFQIKNIITYGMSNQKPLEEHATILVVYFGGLE